MLTERFDRAVAYTRTAHDGHLRKGTGVPYFSHLLQVSGLVLEFGGDEDEAIAGLLHDAAEDQGGEPRLADIERHFGSKVAGIVRENSDSLSESPNDKAEWRERKTAYLDAIAHKSESACLVSICDKIHNARSLLADQDQHGDTHWGRFNAGKADALWYYRRLVEEFAGRAEKTPRFGPLVVELKRSVESLDKS